MDEILTIAGMIKIAQIMFIDILLAGDNAIVIGMAARKLPIYLRRKAIFWGTFGAIFIRLVLAILFVGALKLIPFLHLAGGILLMWIAMHLVIKDKSKEGHNIEAKDSLRSAIMTIVIADGVMGIDNVLGVVAAAEGHMALVVAGMLVTVPIIIWGSTLFVKLIDRYPIIVYIGGAVLGWVAGDMIIADDFVNPVLGPYEKIFCGICVLIVFVGAKLIEKLGKSGEDPVKV